MNTLPIVSQSTSVIIPVSNATITVTTPSTTSQCSNNDCPGCAGTCTFNTTLGRCHCICQEFVFGDVCVFGVNDTSPQIDTGAIPTRKANITLEIQITFQAAFKDLSSPESLEFIKTLEQELDTLCKEADPQSYKKVQVIKLTPGSVVAESVAEYTYANNGTQIQFINTQLDGVLTDILNNTSKLNKISQAFNASVQLNGLTFQSPEIKNITGLKSFVNCSRFANYTAEISNGQWQCVGPCKKIPDYCHQHGECYNNIYKGPTCSCFQSSLEQFYGPQCDLFRYGPGFYGALFGSLAGALLLIIIIVIAAVILKKRHMSIWKIRNSHNRRLSAFEEDFFDFSDTGDHNLGIAGTYTSEGLRPHLQNIDTQLQVTTNRPEVLNISP
ncbi:uncharacterized protein [Chaetodon trifascialis]|uniref:uncharacterized protein n=1 Tax=Chaetodon trifascialis TaxID=109706 RepID=UPI003993F162